MDGATVPWDDVGRLWLTRFDFGLNPWDIAPMHVIINDAGGMFTGTNGESTPDSGNVMPAMSPATGILHNALHRRLRHVTGAGRDRNTSCGFTPVRLRSAESSRITSSRSVSPEEFHQRQQVPELDTRPPSSEDSYQFPRLDDVERIVVVAQWWRNSPTGPDVIDEDCSDEASIASLSMEREHIHTLLGKWMKRGNSVW